MIMAASIDSDVLDTAPLEASKLPSKEVLRVLITGKAGSGKSTLANGIVDSKNGKEVRRTAEFTEYSLTADKGVRVTIWDSSVAQDGKVSDMKKEYCDADVVLFCIKMTETRLTKDSLDVIAMKKQTEAFGEDLWRRTVVILTFANAVESVDISMQSMNSEEKKAAFTSKLENWKDVIVDTLTTDVQLSQGIAKAVFIAPAGHHRIPSLPNCNNWIDDMWECLMKVLESRSAQQISYPRETPRAVPNSLIFWPRYIIGLIGLVIVTLFGVIGWPLVMIGRFLQKKFRK